jgi:hypothetical protein
LRGIGNSHILHFKAINRAELAPHSKTAKFCKFKEALGVKGGDWKAKMNSIKVAAHREYKPVFRCHL